MAFKYNPKDASKAWPVADETGKPIIYDAVLTAVAEGQSKSSGADMLTLTWEVYNDEGLMKTIKDYITAKSLFKLKNIAKALGKSADFEAGVFNASDYVGSTLDAQLSIKEASGDFDEDNQIRQVYAKHAAQLSNADDTPGTNGPPKGTAATNKAARTAAQQPVGAGIADEDIPF